MKLIEFNANQMNKKFTSCFDDAGSPKDVKKCLKQMQKEVHQLKTKLSHGDACEQVSACIHKIGKIDR